MILTETIFFKGAPIGVVRQCSLTEQINFSPLKGKSQLTDRSWDSVDQLKQAVIKTYSKKKKTPAIKPGLSVPLARTTNHTHNARSD